MALAFLIELPGVTPDQATAILRELGSEDRPPAGNLVHVEGPMEGGGMRIVDVWESQEVFEAFVGQQLAPAFQRAGLTFPADLQPKAVWPVSALLK